ncbi:MAG TPA: PAS domain S-box protein [Gemmatimonadaceae bacterium]|nr:PAS domain S-box protein [Gemmatimonadaceae bacterium]
MSDDPRAADASFYSRALFEQSPFSTVIYDAEGRLLAANAAFERFWGVPVDSAPPDYNVLADPELERQGALPVIRRAFAGETVVTPPVRYDISRLSTSGAGRTVWTQGHFYPVRDAGGRVTHVVLVHVDLTARVEAEEALRLSEERFRTALRGSAVITSSQDRDLRYTWMHNPALGDRVRRVIGKRDMELFERTLDAEAMEAIKRKVLRTGESERREVLVYEDGQPRYYDLTVDPLRDAAGEVAGVICAQIDVTERRRYITERRRAEEALSMQARVLESMREGVSVTNEAGVIVYTNPAEDEMFGYARGELVGQHVTVQNTYPPDENQRIVAEVIAQLKATGEWVGEWQNRRKDGTPFVTRARITAIELGGRAHWVCVQEDVTERKRADEALREAKETAEAASRAKSEFLAVMSHELRTPLNAIGGYVELLEMGVRGALEPGQLADLERIRVNQRRLLGLINDVLNYAKVDAGRVEYVIRPAPVREALDATEPVIQPLAAAKGVALEVEACDQALVAVADPDKVQQVLVNLLSNAVKFTEPGGRVSVACEDDPAARAVRVRVRDTGVGIPADRLDAIFDPFVQVDTRLTRTAGGTGLGLAISRELARGMGGELTAESRVGEGSTFTLTLRRG